MSTRAAVLANTSPTGAKPVLMKGRHLTVANAAQIADEIQAFFSGRFCVIWTSTHPLIAPQPTKVEVAAELVSAKAMVNTDKATNKPYGADLSIVYRVGQDTQCIAFGTRLLDGETEILQDPYESPHVNFEDGNLYITQRDHKPYIYCYTFKPL